MFFNLKVRFYKIRVSLMTLLFKLIHQEKPILFTGKNASGQLCENIAYFGQKKVLIVTDSMLAKLDLIGGIKSSLEENGVASAVFDGVEPDPTYDIVDAGIAMFKSEKCDSILAVGGGSSIDAAKAIAIGANNNVSSAIKLAGPYKGKRRPKPFFCIPTTAGTGSEVTLAAVVSDSKTHKKLPIADHRTIPIAAALDPEIMQGMPQQVTAATGLDALTHAVESYITTIATPATNYYAVAAIRMIFKNLPEAYKNGSNLKAREAMGLASFYAGYAFTRTLLGYVHGIAHQFGGYYGTPHGMANALVLPHILDFSKDCINDKLAVLAKEIGVGHEGMNEEELAQCFIDAVYQLRRDVGLPETLDKLQEKDIPDIAKAALWEAHTAYPVPKYMDKAKCEEIIGKLLPTNNLG